MILDLWRRRALVSLVALVAIVVTIVVMFRISLPANLESRQYQVGIASSRVLVDTPSSQVVAVTADGSDTLGVRANLMASLMVDGELEEPDRQARRHHSEPPLRDGQERQQTDVTDRPQGREAHVLTTNVLQDSNGKDLPIIQIEAQAPDAKQAARLADGAVDSLRDYLATKAAAEQVPDARRLKVEGFGPAQSSVEKRGPGLIMAIAAGLFVFALGCAAILGIAALVSALRAPEQLGDAPMPMAPSREPMEFAPVPKDATRAQKNLGRNQPESSPLKLVDGLEADAAAAVHSARTPRTPPAPSAPPSLRWDTGAPASGDARQAK